MKKILIFALCFVCTLANAAAGDWTQNIPKGSSDGNVHYGPTRIVNKTLPSLTFMAPLW